MTKGEIMFMIGMVILTGVYFLFRERVFPGVIKWIVSGALFLSGIIGILISNDHWDQFLLWCVASALFLCIVFEVLKNYTLHNRAVYVPPDEIIHDDLSEQEKFEMDKIVVVLVVIWTIAGYFITVGV
jgi:hypothetical protein